MRNWMRDWVQLIVVVGVLVFLVIVSILALGVGICSLVMIVFTLIFPFPLPWFFWLMGMVFSLLVLVESWRGFSWLAENFVSPIGQGEGVEVVEPWC